MLGFFLITERPHKTSLSYFQFVACPIQLIARRAFHTLRPACVLTARPVRAAVCTPEAPGAAGVSLAPGSPYDLFRQGPPVSPYTETCAFCSMKPISVASHRHKMLLLASDFSP